MITIVASGYFRLIETRRGVKILQLNADRYAWLMVSRIGSLLVRTTRTHREFDVLSQGHFRLYDVADEPSLSDQLHLELEVGQDAWQGYLLPTGLPTRHHKRKRIIPTHEIISVQSAQLRSRITAR